MISKNNLLVNSYPVLFINDLYIKIRYLSAFANVGPTLLRNTILDPIKSRNYHQTSNSNGKFSYRKLYKINNNVQRVIIVKITILKLNCTFLILLHLKNYLYPSVG